MSQSFPMNRRKWLSLATASIPAIGSGSLNARERTGRWDDESIADYTQRLIDWVQADFAARAEMVEKTTGKAFPIVYDYLAPTEDKKKLRVLDKFKEGRLAKRATKDHVSSCMLELEMIRRSLVEEEAKAAKIWKQDPGRFQVMDGKIYDTEVSAGRLAVVLDKSNSMRPYLEKLRAEIKRDFADAYFIEVNGCHLQSPPDYPWFYAAPVPGFNPFAPERFMPRLPTYDEEPHIQFIIWTRALTSALHSMVDLMHADAIYWFCDFDDAHYDHEIRSFAQKVMEKKVKLYAHTVDKHPPKLVKQLAEESGGAFIRKRI